jgi:hypothetical protein
MKNDLNIKNGNYITLYKVIDGKLTACRLTNPRWITPWGDVHQLVCDCEYRADGSQAGKVNLCGVSKYFLSIEEYKLNHYAHTSEIIYKTLSLTKGDVMNLFDEIMNENGIRNAGRSCKYIVYKWGKKDLKPVDCCIDLNEIVIVSGICYFTKLLSAMEVERIPICNIREEKCLIDWEELGWYKTKEDCRAANHIDIVDFAD